VIEYDSAVLYMMERLLGEVVGTRGKQPRAGLSALMTQRRV
jgi:hypothetical protein